MEPITNGVITGVFNGSVSAGLAYPALYGQGNGTVEVPFIILWGKTRGEGMAFLVRLEGVGKVAGQAARVVSFWSEMDDCGVRSISRFFRRLMRDCGL